MRQTLLLLALSQGIAISVSALLISSTALVGQNMAPDPAMSTVPAGMQYLSTMLVMFPAAMLMQAKGRKFGFSVAACCLIISGALLTLAVFQSAYWLFCFGLVFAGAGLGFFQYLRFAAIDVVPKSMAAKAISWVLAGGLIAAFLGPSVAAYTQMKIPQYPFAMTFLVLIPFGCILLLMIAVMKLPLPSVEERTGSKRPVKEIIKQPVFLVAVVGAMTAYGVMNLIMTSTPLAMKGHGFSFGETAIVIQFHIASMFVPSFFSGYLIDRFGTLKVMLSGTLLLIIVVVINNLGHDMFSYWSALVLLGIGWNFLFVGSTSLLQQAWRPAEKGWVQGVNDTMVYTLTMLTAFGAGVLYELFGWQKLNLLVLPILVVMVALVLWLMVWFRRHSAAAATLN